MKIEIEFEEVENLNKQISILQDQLKEIQKKFDSLDPKVLHGNAIELSWKLFESYMNGTFKKLGFDYQYKAIRFNNENLEHWLGKSWYESERLSVELEVMITSKFRSAFLQLGIIPKESDI